MAISRWDPLSDLLGIQRDLSDLFQRTFGETPVASGNATNRRRSVASFVPPIDLFGREGNLVVRAELPGVKPEDVDVTFHNGVLTLRGERKHESKIDDGSYYRMESSYGSFQRQIQLPETVAADDISANYTDGVLEIVIPQQPAVQPKKVQIAVGEGSPEGESIDVTEGRSNGEAKAEATAAG